MTTDFMKKLTYKGDKTTKIKFPLGGIGTGCISLMGDGSLSDFELFGRPDKKISEGFGFFAVKAERDGKLIDARVLNSDLHPTKNISFSQSDIHLCDYKKLAYLPSFERPDFSLKFPYAYIDFKSSDFPATVRMTAFNPFIPLNDSDSSIPCAMFEFEIENTDSDNIDFSLCGALENPLEFCKNSFDGDMNGRMKGLRFSSKNDLRDDGQLDSKYNAKNLCIATDCENISYQQYFTRDPEDDVIEVFWDDFTGTKHFKNRTYTDYGKNDVGAICAHITLEPGEKKTVRFVISWYMRFMTNFWSPQPQHDGESDRNFIDKNRWKNYYARYFSSSFECAEYCFIHWNRLKSETDVFTDALFDTTIPKSILTAVTSELSVLKSAKVMRHSDGNLIDFDTLQTGNSAHICNYSYAIAHLFPSLERGLRETSYKVYMDEYGAVNAANCAPLGRKPETFFPHADGQLGGIIKLYREFKLCGDKNWLEIMWPYAKESLDFAFVKGNGFEWDPDKTGVFSGRQRICHGYDLYAPDPYTQGLYTIALKCAYEISMILGKTEEADFYGNLFDNAKRFLNKELFNGKFFSSKENANVSCADQTIAQWHAQNIGICDIFDKENFLSSLEYIYNNNYTGSGVLTQRFSSTESDSENLFDPGIEYALVCLMLQNGMKDKALSVLDAVNKRFDGENRNPFSVKKTPISPLRATSAYALLSSVCGFTYDLYKEYLSFVPHIEFSEDGYFKCFFSAGKAYGTIEVGPKYIEMKVLKGEFMLKRLGIFTEPKVVYYCGRKLDFKAQGNVAVFDVNVKCNKEKGITVIYD